MKKALYILGALSLMLLPVGFAFAENMIPPPPSGENVSPGDQQNGPGPQIMGGGDQQEGQQGGDRWNIPVHIQQGGPMGGSRDNQDRPNISSSSEVEQQWASSTPRGGEGMPWLNGMKRGIMRHFGTTTPPGFFEQHGSSSDESASSSNDHRAWFPGVPQFWKWLFGANSNSSTTATSSQQLSPPQDQNQGANNDNGSSTQPHVQPDQAFWGGFFERLKSLF